MIRVLLKCKINFVETYSDVLAHVNFEYIKSSFRSVIGQTYLSSLNPNRYSEAILELLKAIFSPTNEKYLYVNFITFFKGNH